MKILIIWICSFLVAGIIISPFFWLRFLKKMSKWKYVILSSTVTLGLFYFFVTTLYDFILKYIHHYNQLDYFDGISMGSTYIILLLIILAPFIFTKIIYGCIKIKSFFVALFFSVIIFILLFLFWVYVLLPVAFSQLHNYL